MKDSLVTLEKAAVTEIMVKKSRFIASAFPVKDEQEAVSLINQVKKEHSQANHNVYAYLMNEQVQRCSDDGEPSGTAGKPVLEVIKHKGLSQAAVVVTRYFGGILLGAGGLVRAYTEVAVQGIEKAGAVEKTLYLELRLTLDYQWLGLIKYELANAGGRRMEIAYEQAVYIKVYVKPAIKEALCQRLNEATAGQVGIQEGAYGYI